MMEINHDKSISYAEVYIKTDAEKKQFKVYYQGFDPYIEEHDWVDLCGDWYSEHELEFINIKYN